MRYFVALLVMILQVKTLEVHEWGTFTTMVTPDGRQLTGMEKEEEALPKFVHDMTGQGITVGKGFYPGFKPKNVTVRMETPVIYFYSDKEVNFEVKVGFKGGVISQWYPFNTTSFMQNKERVKKFLKDGNSSKEYGQIVWDFAKPTYDESIWRGKVLSPYSEKSYSSPQSQETVTWVNPRHTDSNLIEIGRQVEKFIFYRGVASFEQGLKFNAQEDGVLKIQNHYGDTVPYVLVYEYKQGKKLIHWQGRLAADEKVDLKLNGEVDAKYHGRFIKALVDNGLFRKEAQSMLETWRHSYFEKPGLRVFYILPRKDVDEILPMTVKPKPEKLERVIVGKAEILRYDEITRKETK